MKAILTKYLGPTNNRGSRVKAYDECGNQVTVSWNFELGVEENHQAAAQAFVQKMGWKWQDLIGGSIKEGFAFIFNPYAK